MGFLQRLFGGPAQSPALPRVGTFDPICFGDVRGRELRRELAEKRWPQVEEFLQKHAGTDLLSHYIHVCSDWPGRPQWLDHWVRDRPNGPLPFLVRGSHSIQWAWEARTAKRASEVTEEGWTLFLKRLELAMADLEVAAEMAPREAEPWALMIRAYTGLGRDLEERRDMFAEATRRAPRHRLAHWLLLGGLCKKWGGSHDEMFDFARSASREAGPRSPLHGLVAVAHMERWLYFSFDDDRVGDKAYFTDSAVGDELVAAYEQFRGMPVPALSMPVANWFAHSLYLADRRREAALALRDTRGVHGELPWGWSGNPAKVYDRTARDLGVSFGAAS